MKKQGNRIFYILAGFTLLAIVLTYSNHFQNAFHFDDAHTVVENVYIRSLNNTGEFFTNPESRSNLPANRQYRPMLTLTYATDYWMGGGLKPFYFHLTTFIGFILQLSAMYVLILHLFNSSSRHPWNRYFALFAVAWYGLHTTGAETINYISARSDSFSTLLIILALLAYIYFKRYWKFLWIAPAALGMLIKPTTAMFAPLLVGYIFCFESRLSLKKFAFGSPLYRNGLLQGFLAFLTCGALFYFVMYMTPETWTPGGQSRLHYLITQPWVTLHYFKTFFLPTNLTADTDWRLITTLLDFRFIVGLLFIILLTIAGVLSLRKDQYKPIAYGIFWFFMALMPSSSLVPLSEVLNYHRIFFPYVGLVIAVSWVMALIIMRYQDLWANKIYRSLLIVCVLSVLTLNAYGTVVRNKVWHNGESLWYDVTLKSPKNGRGLMNYGLTQMAKGDLTRAEWYFMRALEYVPYYSYLQMNMGVLNQKLNKPKAAEQHFRNAVAYDRKNPVPYYFYGNWLLRQERFEEAELYLRQSIALNYSYMFPRYALMLLYSKLKDWTRLQDLANESLAIDPTDVTARTYIKISQERISLAEQPMEDLISRRTPDAYIQLSLVFYKAGLFRRSIAACQEALHITPDSAQAFNIICSAHNELGEWKKAISACNQALTLKPDFELARNNLNWAKQNLAP